MEEFTLQAQPRKELGTTSAKQARANALIPAVIYGPEISPEHILLARSEFDKVEAKAGETSFITIDVRDDAGSKGERRVLIKEIERNPLNQVIQHVDFYQPKTGAKVRAKIPLVFTGTSPLIEAEGGVLVKSLQEFEVFGRPEDLPHEVVVDISRINSFEERVLVKDIALPAGVEAGEDSEVVVASVVPAEKEEEVAVAAAAEAIEQVKVEDEEKKAAREKDKEAAKQ